MTLTFVAFCSMQLKNDFNKENIEVNEELKYARK